MDKLLKHALDGDAVNFVNRMKEKMAGHRDDAVADITRKVSADMAGTPVQEKKDEKMHVVARLSDTGTLKWETSTGRTGGDPKQKLDKSLKAYFKKVLGTSDFTLEILESEDGEMDDDDENGEMECECEGCGKKYKGKKGSKKCPKCKREE